MRREGRGPRTEHKRPTFCNSRILVGKETFLWSTQRGNGRGSYHRGDVPEDRDKLKSCVTFKKRLSRNIHSKNHLFIILIYSFIQKIIYCTVTGARHCVRPEGTDVRIMDRII